MMSGSSRNSQFGGKTNGGSGKRRSGRAARLARRTRILRGKGIPHGFTLELMNAY
jgi:hypothetical protein